MGVKAGPLSLVAAAAGFPRRLVGQKVASLLPGRAGRVRVGQPAAGVVQRPHHGLSAAACFHKHDFVN